VPPPSKKAREGEAAPSVPAPMQPGRKLKREWANSFNAEAPPTQAFSRGSEATPAAQVTAPVQEINVTSPFALQHALPGPSRADPAAQEHSDAAPSTLQHALPGPSGAQAQTDYANVSIFLQTIL
jgi:hypothetical protein